VRSTSHPSRRWQALRVHRPTAFPRPPAAGKKDPTLSMAVLVYTGVGISSYPTSLPDALADYLGSDRADAFKDRVDALRQEAWLDRDEWGANDLVAVTREIEDRMRVAHPELSEDAIQALGWTFSYNNR